MYTDGVTEANNSKNELFGEARMLDALNLPIDGDLLVLESNVKDSIDAFIDGNPQFDDITMLSMKYNGPQGAEGTGDAT